MADTQNQPCNTPAAPETKPDAADQVLAQMYAYFDRDDIRAFGVVSELDALKAA